jgi:hypothetical protein
VCLAHASKRAGGECDKQSAIAHLRLFETQMTHNGVCYTQARTPAQTCNIVLSRKRSAAPPSIVASDASCPTGCVTAACKLLNTLARQRDMVSVALGAMCGQGSEVLTLLQKCTLPCAQSKHTRCPARMRSGGAL